MCTLQLIPLLKIYKRNLPHWELPDSVYFITFNLITGKLNDDEILLVGNHLIEGDNIFYDLYAAVVMNNHAHVILKPILNYTLSRIMKGIKGVSANKINELRGSKGSIWQDESFDRILRDEKEFNEKLEYMFNNPIKAGITEDTWTYIGWYFNERLF